MSMKKIRVMIVEDSRVVREFLQQMIEDDVRLEVAAAMESAEEALEVIHDVSPDVISMDIRLPGMNGLEATQRIMRDKPTPIVVVAASVDSGDLCISMNALAIGALAVVEKPRVTTPRDYQALADHLCTQLALMSQVKVIRQRFAGAGRLDLAGLQVIGRAQRAAGPFHLAGIVASTGGPAALQKLLAGLDPWFPIPIALVQHISEGFLGGFVSWLDSACPFRVVSAQDGETPVPGTVYVAPANRHLRVERGVWHLDAGQPVSSQRPSGTVLFQSMAQSLGPRALGVLLTGMGEDGAAGLKELRDAGGYTIAEDESTAVVFGMPAAAVRLGAVREVLPLHQMSGRLKQLASLSKETSR
jgi:two-component system, chemotaxis family, protein-glutamate methylesterase/glutaminase